MEQGKPQSLAEAISEYVREAYHQEGWEADNIEGMFSREDFTLYCNPDIAPISIFARKRLASMTDERFNELMLAERNKVKASWDQDGE